MRCQVLPFFVGVSSAAVCRHEWVLRDHVVNYLDPMATLTRGEAVPEKLRSSGQYVNQMYPGPSLDCYENDDVEVLLVNQLVDQGATIHWHGLYMNNETGDAPTPWADGVHHFSHAPIMPGQNYTYRFKAWPPGTHWWHSHMDALQMDRGVKGPIVIRKHNDPHRHLYDEERILFLSDTRRVPDVCLKLEGQAMDVGNPVCNEVDKMSWNGQYGNGSQLLPYPQIEVEAGKCYRFRWIGAAGNTQNWHLKVAGHNQTLIAVDGQDVYPMPVREFNLHTGERYDTIFCADQKPGNYLVNATYDLSCQLVASSVGFGKDMLVPFVPLPPVDSCWFYAFIKYKGHDEVPINANPAQHGGWPEGTGGGKNANFPGNDTGISFDLNGNDAGYLSGIRNMEVIPEPEKADLEITLYGGILGGNTSFRPGGHNPAQGRGQFGLPMQAGWSQDPATKPMTKSGRTYLSTRSRPREFWSMSPHWPSTPVLHVQGTDNPTCGTNGANIIDVPEDAKVIELTLVNLSPSAHVFHLHGMHFQVVNYGFPEWCNYEHHNECFFMPYAISHEVAKHTIGGRSVNSDPEHPNLGGGFYWGVEPNKTHPNYIKTLNLEAPLRKDMISLWRHQWAVIRVRPTNPGVWLLHCHMEQHVPTGMIVALNVLPSKQPPIPHDTPTSGSCPVHGWSYSTPADAPAATASLEVMDWVVDYQRPTREGDTWFSKRLSPNELEPEVRSAMVLANGAFPGTKLEMKEGDKVAVQVQHRGFAEGVAVHWHGLTLPGTPWADGTADVSQAPLPPQNNQTYEFIATPAGTHFYTGSSNGLMAAKGLKGALIIHPTTDPRANMYDSEFLMQISDSWHEPEACFIHDGEAGNPLCPPVDRVTFDGMFGDGSKYYPYPRYEVEHGKCYRVRMLGLMNQVNRVNVSIAGHDMKLLAVDGTEVEPVDVSSIIVHAGERFDFQLCAKEKLGNYLITAEASHLCDAQFLASINAPAPETCVFHAFLHYDGARKPGSKAQGTGGGARARSSLAPSLDLASWGDLAKLQPVSKGSMRDLEVDATFNFTLGRTTDGFMFLHTSPMPWTAPSTPLLMTGASQCADNVPVVRIPEAASTVVLIVTNKLNATESIHLHGLRFQVVRMTGAGDGPESVSGGPTRDTVALAPGATAFLQVQATNPGVWMLQAMSATVTLRGASTALLVQPSKIPAIPKGIPTQGPCSGDVVMMV
mmetsp:Transcript_39996/g.84538  ORF Transcript_39996/g.84538 Transcript_39996/m.84538 type:complete len:1210 (+) Transcript_39996:40-3669(+)